VDHAVARERLEGTLADVERSMATLEAESTRPAAPEGRDIDTADPGSALSDADREGAVIDAMKTQARYIRAALGRIEDGTYGRCLDCGAELPPERLDARPEASRCVRCQAKSENGR
jgi:RNA polymerase-binding transcription factor DksA